jgi:SAM-dependent methyltransferase
MEIGGESPYLNYVIKRVKEPKQVLLDRFIFWNELVRRLHLSPSDKVLEIGSCIGRTVDALDTFKIGSIGIDTDMTAISKGYELGYYSSDKNPGIVAEGSKLPIASGVFDVVISWDVLEHVPEKELLNVVAEMRRVLKPNGKMSHRITTTEDKNINSDPTHVTKWSQDRWIKWFSDTGWEVVGDSTRIIVKNKPVKLLGHKLFSGKIPQPVKSWGHFVLKKSDSQ